MTSAEFERAKNDLTLLKTDPGNDAKLRIYALFKQATAGPCQTPKPGMLDVVGKAKWQAWKDLGAAMSKQEAERKYIEFIGGLLRAENPGYQSTTVQPTAAAAGRYTEFLVTIEHDKIFKITFNRPKKLNSFNSAMYKEISAALKEAELNPEISCCVITGSGNYYSAGNDLSNYLKNPEGDLEAELVKGTQMVREFIDGFIKFPKPLIALVNGPAVGIAFTVLALFDMVIASDRATFSAPFTRLSLSPEGCSSYTFPQLMGRMKAADILLFNRKITAQEALERNLVAKVIADEKFAAETAKFLEEVAKIPQKSFIVSKNVLRMHERDTLLEVNRKEVEILLGQFRSGEFMTSVLEFMSRKPKL